jgi:hemerythrin-like domain-containing protein
MEATRILMDEHRVIERLLASLALAAERFERGEAVRPAFFVEAADFIKGFADPCHHRKEEGLLFPAMEAAGVANQGGPIGVMLTEQEEGRQLTRAMRSAAEQAKAGDPTAWPEIVRNVWPTESF